MTSPWIFITVITTVIVAITQPLLSDTASIAAGTLDVSSTTRRRSCKTTVMLTGVVQHSLAFVHAVRGVTIHWLLWCVGRDDTYTTAWGG